MTDDRKEYLEFEDDAFVRHRIFPDFSKNESEIRQQIEEFLNSPAGKGISEKLENLAIAEIQKFFERDNHELVQKLLYGPSQELDENNDQI